jgi:hypothetical protein
LTLPGQLAAGFHVGCSPPAPDSQTVYASQYPPHSKSTYQTSVDFLPGGFGGWSCGRSTSPAHSPECTLMVHRLVQSLSSVVSPSSNVVYRSQRTTATARRPSNTRSGRMNRRLRDIPDSDRAVVKKECRTPLPQRTDDAEHHDRDQDAPDDRRDDREFRPGQRPVIHPRKHERDPGDQAPKHREQ